MSEIKKQEKPKKQIKIIEKLKKIKHIEIIVAVVFIAVLLLIYFAGNTSGLFGSGSKSSGKTTTDSTSDTYARQVEKRLQELITSIKGAGEADVMINFESTPELIIAYIENITKNSGLDGDGKYNENTTSSKNPVILNQSGTQLPLILKELAPNVLGIMIVAKGAGDPKVKLEIISAVSILMNVNPNKIAVLEKK